MLCAPSHPASQSAWTVSSWPRGPAVLFVLAETPQQEISAGVASPCPDVLTRLSAVEESPERGPCRKRSAGGRIVAKRVASRSGALQRASAAPAGLEIAFNVEPGRSTTTIGTRSAIERQ